MRIRSIFQVLRLTHRIPCWLFLQRDKNGVCKPGKMQYMMSVTTYRITGKFGGHYTLGEMAKNGCTFILGKFKFGEIGMRTHACLATWLYW